MDYQTKSLPYVDGKPDEEIANAVLELAILGSQLGLTVNDLASLLRSGLSLEDLVVHMANQLTGRVQ